jgi:hypothetical protein
LSEIGSKENPVSYKVTHSELVQIVFRKQYWLE